MSKSNTNGWQNLKGQLSLMLGERCCRYLLVEVGSSVQEPNILIFKMFLGRSTNLLISNCHMKVSQCLHLIVVNLPLIGNPMFE